MSTKYTDQQAHLIEKVVAQINSKLPAKQAALVAQFAERIYASIAYEDLAARTASDLYGSVLSLWNFIQGREAGNTKLRVFNPTFEQHGWQSSHTVIEIGHDERESDESTRNHDAVLNLHESPIPALNRACT